MVEETLKLGAARMGFFARDMQRLVAYFYTDNGLLTLTQAACLRRYFDALTDMFDSVGLQTNVSKTRSTAFKYQKQKLRCLWMDYYYDLPLFWS